MKKEFLLPALVSAFILLSAGAHAADRLLMVAEEYPPYEYTENGVLKGIDIEMIQAASEKLGIRADIKFYPWARALEMVKTGEADAIFSLFRTEGRETFLYYPQEALANEKNILIASRDSTKKARTLEDLAGWKIGVVRGNSYGKAFDAYKKITLHEVTSIEQLIQMAAAGNRFDATPVNEYVFAYKVRELGLTGRFQKLDFIVTDEPLYIGFSRAKGESHQKLAEAYSRVLMQLRQEGVIEGIIQKYTSF